MRIAELIEALSDPACFPEGGEAVEVVQTHISVVFLVGGRAYKVRKPVVLDFLDFSTLALRREDCEAEVRLNRRYSPDVYLGVVPIARADDGLQVGGSGEVVEWAVAMRRLEEAHTLKSRLKAGTVDEPLIRRIGAHIAGLHADAAGGPEIARFGRFDVVAGNARENLEETRDQVGVTVHPAVHDRVEAWTEQRLTGLEERIEARAEAGVPRDCHGDLRLEHVYIEPDGRLLLVDCIEFNDRFRYADPASDLAFLAMDLDCRGHHRLADALQEAWVSAAEDPDAEPLLPFYRAYRSLVRAKVAGFQLLGGGLDPEPEAALRDKARMHWGYALAQLAAPADRPGLVGIGGLPGTGKSTLAAGLARDHGFTWIRSDAVRKELAGLAPTADATAEVEGGIYTPAFTERTYTTCLERADAALQAGRRVCIDATFREERWRTALLDLARAHGVPGGLLFCEAPEATVLERLAARTGDASDADARIHRAVRERWEAVDEAHAHRVHAVDASGDVAALLASGRKALADLGLAASR